MKIRVKLADIFEIEPQIPDQPRGLAAITAYVLKHYAFLPKPIAVTVEGDEVVISYPEEADAKREEAERLAASSGEASATRATTKKAIGIYKRVARISSPAFHAARRDLAMAYMEVGDVENATNHLIEVLRLDPKDAWSWVVLGKSSTSGKKPIWRLAKNSFGKLWKLNRMTRGRLNSLAAGYQKKGQTREAVDYFDRAIEANP